MLQQASKIRGVVVEGYDGKLGEVDDLHFDAYRWRVHYLVLRVDGIVSKERCLLSPTFIEASDWQQGRLTARMTRDLLEGSAESELDKHVAKQLEQSGADYAAGTPPSVRPVGSAAAAPRGEPSDPETDREGRPLVRSFDEVSGYAVDARNGRSGFIQDLLVDTQAWTIEYMLVHQRHLLPSPTRQVPTSWCGEFDWVAHCVRMNVARDQIHACPEYSAWATPGQMLDRT
jgi:hypothetical protein